MNLDEARQALQESRDYVRLAEAIGVVISSTASSLEDIMLGLRHGGFIAEQAALALYKRTGRPLPEDRNLLEIDAAQWRAWITRSRAASLAT
jgi:hypothetical protein